MGSAKQTKEIKCEKRQMKEPCSLSCRIQILIRFYCTLKIYNKIYYKGFFFYPYLLCFKLSLLEIFIFVYLIMTRLWFFFWRVSAVVMWEALWGLLFHWILEIRIESSWLFDVERLVSKCGCCAGVICSGGGGLGGIWLSCWQLVREKIMKPLVSRFPNTTMDPSSCL